MNVNISIGYSASDILYEDVELEFKTGEVNNIIGENGTGKSTFYKTLIGELKPLSGTVPLEIKKNIAIVSDYISLPLELKILDIEDFLGNENISYMKKEFEKLTNIISSFKNHKISELSTGQKRIVEIFVALSTKKKILILDEACNGLDFKNRSFFLDNIKDLVQNNKVSILHTSHNLEDVIDLGGNVYVLDKFNKKFCKYYGNLSITDLRAFIKNHWYL